MQSVFFSCVLGSCPSPPSSSGWRAVLSESQAGGWLSTDAKHSAQSAPQGAYSARAHPRRFHGRPLFPRASPLPLTAGHSTRHQSPRGHLLHTATIAQPTSPGSGVTSTVAFRPDHSSLFSSLCCVRHTLLSWDGARSHRTQCDYSRRTGWETGILGAQKAASNTACTPHQ